MIPAPGYRVTVRRDGDYLLFMIGRCPYDIALKEFVHPMVGKGWWKQLQRKSWMTRSLLSKARRIVSQFTPCR